MITEIREFFKLEVLVKAISINLDNVECHLNSITLYQEFEDKTITIKGSDREVLFEKVRTYDGFKVNIFITNDSEEYEERIDWLLDEDFEIEDIDMTITNASSKEEYEFAIQFQVGEQVVKEVEIELNSNLKNAINYISNNLTTNLSANHIYDIMSQNHDLTDFVSKISNIDVL